MLECHAVTPFADMDARRNGRPERLGDVLVSVTGVSKPFRFFITAQVVKDAAPFGKPSTASIMRLAQDLARQQCQQRMIPMGRN